MARRAVHGIAWSSSGDLYLTADRGGTERWQVYVRHPDSTLEDFAVSDGDRVQHHMSRNAVSPDGSSVAISTNGRQTTPAAAAIAGIDFGGPGPFRIGARYKYMWLGIDNQRNFKQVQAQTVTAVLSARF